MSILRPPSRPALFMAAAGVAMAGALGIAGTASAADWPMFRANPGHSGVSPETAISTTTAHSLTTRWTARLGTPSYTSPAVATSRGKALVYASAGNHFYAYPARGGAAAWRFTLPAGVVETRPRWPVASCTSPPRRHHLRSERLDWRADVLVQHRARHPRLSGRGQSAGSGPVVYDGTLPTGYRERNTPSTVPATRTVPARRTGHSPRGRAPQTVPGPLRRTGWARTAFRCSCSAARTAMIPCTRSTPTPARGSGAIRRAPRPIPTWAPLRPSPRAGRTASPTALST